jgi:hypothetical protein
MPRVRKGAHVVLDATTNPRSIRCTHCGASEPTLQNVRVEVFVAQGKSYEKLHMGCLPGGPVRGDLVLVPAREHQP